MINNQRGMALFVVMLALTFISIIGLSLAGFAATNLKQSTNERNHQSTYYVAEAGARYVLNDMSSKLEDIHNDSSVTNGSIFFSEVETDVLKLGSTWPYSDFTEAFGENPNAKIIIEHVETINSNQKKYKLTSLGEIGNRSRTVETEFILTYNISSLVPTLLPMFNNTAVFTEEGTISLSGSSQIHGSVGSNTTVINSIQSGGSSTIHGDILVIGADQNIVGTTSLKSKVKDSGGKRILELPAFPEYPPLTSPGGTISSGTISTNSYYSRISGGVTFNTGNSENVLEVRVKDLQVNNPIRVEGDGTLKLYIEDTITFSGGNSGTFNAGKIDNVYIYHSGTSGVTMSNNNVLHTYLFYTKTASVKFTGGTFTGHLFSGGSGTVEFGGNGLTNSQLVIAPYASGVLSGGTEFKGSIFTKDFKNSGNADVYQGAFTEVIIDTVFPPTSAIVGIGHIYDPGRILEKK